MTRLVVISSTVPFDNVPHAGGRYLGELMAVARDLAPGVAMIAPDTPAARHAARSPGHPDVLWLLGPRRKAGPWQRLRNWRDVRADLAEQAYDPGARHAAMERALRQPSLARAAIEQADVIDLQWSETVRSASVLRGINPRARMVGTFHDVQSQLFAREAEAASGADRERWLRGHALAREWEQRALRELDTVVVFSEKDRALIANGTDDHKIVIVPPPLATGLEQPRDHTPTGEVVAVVANYSRTPNQRGAAWLVEEVWPHVQAVRPSARLRLVGAGMSEEMAMAMRAKGVEVTGEVADLDAEYAQVRVAAVPLRHGAGVKFKTIEAMLADVPVVTTTVGAEGVAGPERFAGFADTADGFAEALVAVLADPEAAGRSSREALAWAQQQFGRESLGRRLREVWALPPKLTAK